MMKSNAMPRSQLVLLLILSVTVDAFTTNLPRNRHADFHSIAAKRDDSNVEDYNEMRNLVLSLSQVATDEDRRSRLANIFEQALARPNGQPKEFTDLFAEALTNVGNEVQTEAKKNFAAKEAETSNQEAVKVPDDSPENQESDGERVKSTEEQQLWALVDMMVQSKTIVKKASGELGSKGTFQ